MARASRAQKDRSSEALRSLAGLAFRRGRIRRSLQEVLRRAVQTGELAMGARVPSSRVLAAQLGVSRGVVTDTYDQLASEGYLRVTPRSAPTVAIVQRVAGAEREVTRPRWRFDFVATTPDLSLFPRRRWTRALERALRTAPDEALDYTDHRGLPELRTALTGYLVRVRAVRADPGRLVIVQGFTQGIDLACRALRDRGARTIAIESPSLPPVWESIRATGLRVVGCAVDGEGLRVDRLVALHAGAVVVTPSHQFPTGAVMSPSRRAALLEWAAGRDAFVIEDDYDAEFRFDRRPVGALQGLDPARVIHIGTASKTLAPGVRLGWMSVPADLFDPIVAAKGSADSGSPALDQLALAQLLVDGEYERHVARMRHTYRARRDRLVRAIAARLPEATVEGAAAGMHILLPLDATSDDVAISRAAAERGIRLQALSPMYLGRSKRRGLLLGYGRLGEDSIGPAVSALARVLQSGR
jgi:GntR family transcriptional regulator / MocR family aminotransferase